MHPAGAGTEPSRAHPDVHAVVRLAGYEDVLVVDGFAIENGPGHGQVFVLDGRHPIRVEELPRLVCPVTRTPGGVGFDDSFGPGVHVQVLPVGVGDDDAFADAVESGFHQIVLILQLRHRLAQPFLGPLAVGDVLEKHDAAGAADVPVQGLPADLDVDPVGFLLVADEHFHGFHGPALHGAHERNLVGGDAGFPVRVEDAVGIRPRVRRHVQHPDADDAFGAGIEQHEFPRGVGHDHAVADAVEYGFHEIGLVLGFPQRLRQLVFRQPLLRNVVNDAHGADDLSTVFAVYRPRAGVDVLSSRDVVIAHEEIELVRFFPLQGAPEREFFGRNERFPVRVEYAVGFRPLSGVDLPDFHPGDCLEASVGEQQPAVLVGDDDAVVHAVEHGLHQLGLLAQLVDGPFQVRFRLLDLGDVAKDHHAAVSAGGVETQRFAAGADVHSFRRCLVADEHFDPAGLFTADGALERKLIRREQPRPVGVVEPESRRALGDVVVRYVVVGDLQRRRIGHQVFAVFVGGEDAVADAVEDEVREVDLAVQLGDGAFQVELRALEPGDVAKDEEAASLAVLVDLDRPAADVEIETFGVRSIS